MGYVETLFGHQDHILSLDALRGDVCVSVGARDKTVRYWKIVDETQLVFRGGGRSRIREVLEGGLKGDEEGDDMDVDGASKKGQQKSYIEGSLECVCMIDETTFVSGGDSGSLSLWSTTKKKPIFTQPLAHGLEETESSTEGTIRTPRWVTSLGCLRYSNIFASGMRSSCSIYYCSLSYVPAGSYDGFVLIWKLDPKLKSFSLAGTIPAPGIVNSLQLLSPPKEFTKHTSWLTHHQNPPSNPPLPPQVPPAGSNNSTHSHSLLVVASLAKEHRFGRWLQQKGVKNTAKVFYFTSRTSSSS